MPGDPPVRRSAFPAPNASVLIMRVVLDATAVQPPLAGVQRAVRNEVLALLRTPQPAENRLLLTCDSVLLDAARNAGVRSLSPAAGNSRLRRIFWQQFCLPRLLRAQQADALHAFAYTAPIRCPVRYTLNIHDLIAFERPELCDARNRAHMRLLMPRSIRKADRIVVSSHPVARALRESFGVAADRIVVAPLGVDGDRFASPAPRPARAPASPYLLFVGNVEPKKGIDILLDAWANIHAETGLNLVICGKAAWKSGGLCRRFRSLRRRSGFCWFEDVGNAELPGLYQHAFAAVLPSRIEGFGLPVLEAMAAGRPVIHSDYPVLLETAGGWGFAFRNGDPKSLENTILQVWNMPADPLEKITVKAQARARNQTWNQWAETLHRCTCNETQATQNDEHP